MAAFQHPTTLRTPTWAAPTRGPSAFGRRVPRPADLHSAAFSPTHFDPLLDEKARASERASLALEVCSAMLALRVVLGVQVALALGVLVSATGTGDWLVRQSGAMYVGVAGTLLWLVTVCALKSTLARRTAAARLGSLLALGAASALIAWWPLWWPDWPIPGTDCACWAWP